MPGNQSKGSDRCLGACSFLFTSGDIILRVGVSVGAQMGPECPCFSWEAINIGVASGNLEVYPISRVAAIGMGTYNSIGEGKHSRLVGSRGLSL